MDFQFLLEPIRRQIRSIVGWALMEKTMPKDKENGVRCSMSMPAGEKLTEVPLVQHYGFCSRPKKGARLLSLFMGGNHGNGFVVGSAGDPSKLPELSEGEAAFYTDAGQKILLKSDGSIILMPADGKKVTIESDVEIKGAVDVTGDLNASGDVISSGDVIADGSVEAAGDVKALRLAAFVTLTKHIHPSAMGPTSTPTPGM